MSVLRAVGRPLIASVFIIQGFETMRHPERVAKQAEPIVQSLAGVADIVPKDTEQAVRINGAVQFAAGALLAVGWVPRLSALAIAGTLVPTTAAGHHARRPAGRGSGHGRKAFAGLAGPMALPLRPPAAVIGGPSRQDRREGRGKGGTGTRTPRKLMG
jgi:uncharacterized membrane protein YphA (DoxX/SURF4 family)